MELKIYNNISSPLIKSDKRSFDKEIFKIFVFEFEIVPMQKVGVYNDK